TGAGGEVVLQRAGQVDGEGELHVELTPPGPGAYRVIARAQAGGRPLEESEVFLVRAEGRELEDVAARSDLLGAVAAATGGRAGAGRLANRAASASHPGRAARGRARAAEPAHHRDAAGFARDGAGSTTTDDGRTRARGRTVAPGGAVEPRAATGRIRGAAQAG